jgi:hypothetical protein
LRCHIDPKRTGEIDNGEGVHPRTQSHFSRLDHGLVQGDVGAIDAAPFVVDENEVLEPEITGVPHRELAGHRFPDREDLPVWRDRHQNA